MTAASTCEQSRTPPPTDPTHVPVAIASLLRALFASYPGSNTFPDHAHQRRVWSGNLYIASYNCNIASYNVVSFLDPNPHGSGDETSYNVVIWAGRLGHSGARRQASRVTPPTCSPCARTVHACTPHVQLVSHRRSIIMHSNRVFITL